VSHVYPVKGNREALGLDLLSLPDQNAAVQRALDSKTTVVAGPVELVQGGTAFIGRTPIYLTPLGEPPNSGAYWGLVTVLIDDEVIFRDSGLSENAEELQYALRGRDGTGARGEVFFGDPAVFGSSNPVLDIQIPGGTWQLAAIPLPGVLSGSSNLWLLRIGGGLLAITGGALAFFATLYNRRRAQERLRDTSKQAEAKFEALAENAQDAIVSADSGGNIIYFNKAAQRAFGYQASEVLGKPLTLLMPERLRGQNLCLMPQFNTEAEPYTVGRIIDTRGEKKDGTEFPVELSLGSWTSEGEKFVTAIFRDVTERTQIAEAISEQRRFLRQVIDIDPNFIFAKDREGRFTLVNQAVAGAFGTTAEQLIGKTDTEVNPNAEEVEFFRRMDLEVMDTLQERFIPEERITDAQGKVRWLQTVKRPIIGANGKATQVLGSSTDITQRKLAEEKLRESEERVARTETFSLVMVTHVDLEGRWLKIPPTLCDLLGYQESELLGHRFQEVTHPDDIDADWNQCLRLFRGEIKSFDLEKRYIRKDGGIVWVYLNCSVVTNEEGTPVQLLSYIRDITERKLDEERLRNYQESLRQLAHQLNATEERERKRFAADLHDHIGQSLVLAKLELGRLGELANGFDEKARAIIERLEDTIDQALHETRSLTQDLSPQVLYAFGLDAALDWLAENMQERYDLVCHRESQNFPALLNDDFAVVAFQVVRELLINVVKHAGVKEASVRVTRKENAVVIEVKDRGKGFVPDNLELPRSHGGGFGLFSIRERLFLLGGSLEIHSKPGGGTFARVVIPVSCNGVPSVLQEVNS
jgi:PAS domain S-box-containing protein